MTKQNEDNIAVMVNDMSYIKRDIAEIKEVVKTGYVTKEEFEPIKRIVYGVVSLLLITVVGAMVSVVVK